MTWVPVQPAIDAYRARAATGGEAAEPFAVRVALAAGVLECLGPLGLKDAFPRYDGKQPRAYGSEVPFWFTRPQPDAPGRFEQITLGGHPSLGAVPGGEVVLHLPIDCCIAVGPSSGDLTGLIRRADEWLWNLAWFFSMNRQLGGLVPWGDSLEDSAPTVGDIQAGGAWYCVRWPLTLQLNYIMPA